MVMPACLEAIIRIIFLLFKHLWPFNFPAGWGSFANFANIGAIIIIFVIIMLVKGLIKIDYPGLNYGTVAGFIISIFGSLITFIFGLAAPLLGGASFFASLVGGSLVFSTGLIAGVGVLIVGAGWVILLFSSEAHPFVKIAAAIPVFISGIILATIEIPLLAIGFIAKPVISMLYGGLLGSKIAVNIVGLILILMFAYIIVFQTGFIADWVCPHLTSFLASLS